MLLREQFVPADAYGAAEFKTLEPDENDRENFGGIARDFIGGSGVVMCIPVPPFPDRLMAWLAPLAKLIASNQLPELMEIWALLGIWSYLVLATFFGFIGLKISASRSVAKNSNHILQRTPNGADEQ